MIQQDTNCGDPVALEKKNNPEVGLGGLEDRFKCSFNRVSKNQERFLAFCSTNFTVLLRYLQNKKKTIYNRLVSLSKWHSANIGMINLTMRSCGLRLPGDQKKKRSEKKTFFLKYTFWDYDCFKR